MKEFQVFAAKIGGLVLWWRCAIQVSHHGGIGQLKVCSVIAEKRPFWWYFYPPTRAYPCLHRGVRIVMAVMHSIWPARVMNSLPAYAAIGDWSGAKREPDHVISRLPSAKQAANLSHEVSRMIFKVLTFLRLRRVLTTRH